MRIQQSNYFELEVADYFLKKLGYPFFAHGPK